jgi:hypothetical protein
MTGPVLPRIPRSLVMIARARLSPGAGLVVADCLSALTASLIAPSITGAIHAA